jgi:hypothetical protein
MFWFAVLDWAVVVLIFDPLVSLALTIFGVFESVKQPP